MLRSKLIADYQETSLEDFRPGITLPSDVHLYFSANRHILVWRKGGETLSAEALAKYLARGMRSVWIYREDLPLWRESLISASQPAAAAAGTVKMISEAVSTEEGRQIVDLIENENLPDRQRTALVARAARELLADTAHAATAELQTQAMAHARSAVREILESVLDTEAGDAGAGIREIWGLTEIDPSLNHGVNVATYAVLFALSFGRIIPEVLGQLALAGLLHDIGLTQIPANLAQLPWVEQKDRARKLYSRHVDEGARLLGELAPELSESIRPMITQHHEKFDGTGYPLELHGAQVGDLALLVSMADAVESMAAGRWDGKTRTLREALAELERRESSGPHPEYFNPEIFGAVVRWTQAPSSTSSRDRAADIVRGATRKV